MSPSDDNLPPGIIRSRPKSEDANARPQGQPEPRSRGADAIGKLRAELPPGSRNAARAGSTETAPVDPDPDLHFDPVGKAREDAYFLLSFSDRSEKELVDRLRKRKHSDDVIDEVLTHLRTEGYLNDANFARRLVESRGKTRGARALSFELKRKGIDGEIAQNALAERGDEDAERAAAWLAATRRVGQPPVADLSPAAAKRLSAFLQRRGFTYSTVRSVLRELFAVDGDISENAEEFEE